MIHPLLILDAHYLCHRAFHASGHLSYDHKATGVVFGFLKSITSFKDEFATDRIVFCFEGGRLLRKGIYPAYKQRRRAARTADEQRAYIDFTRQIDDLRCLHLPKIGFHNVFRTPGYESDDLMAALAASLPDEDEAILITADSDLYQCLRPNVSIYNPQKRKLCTEDWFRTAYHVSPRKWMRVKALAGCGSDNVRGIRGVGELTAVRFLRGILPTDSAAYRKIVSQEGKAIFQRNRQLVELPFPGCPVPEIRVDEITRSKWIEVCGSLGMRSIAGRPPIATRRTL